MTIHLRPSRAVFRFAGNDAAKLLGDVLTAPIAAAPGAARWFALLSPQGKIQAEGLIGWQDGAFWADVDANVAAEFHRRMKLYRLRADMTIEDLSATHQVGWSAEPGAAGIVHADGRTPGLGVREIAEVGETVSWVTDESWARPRITVGIAEMGAEIAPDSTFPHDIGMDFLGGVDFKKGCYIGQEVVSRMQHRGTARRRPVIVSAVDAPAGSAVVAGGREAGAIGQVVEGRAVAIVRLDRIDDPAAVTVEGRPVQLTLPAWASYTFGESAAAE